MAIINKQARILNDLILINNDRVVGYQKAIEELKKEDDDLKLLFQGKINESKEYITQLSSKTVETGHKVETGTTNTGKIYRVWMDVKAFFGGFDRKVVLDNCENVENAALIAYNDALTSEGLSTAARSLLTTQYAALKISYDKIKALKEAQK